MGEVGEEVRDEALPLGALGQLVLQTLVCRFQFADLLLQAVRHPVDRDGKGVGLAGLSADAALGKVQLGDLPGDPSHSARGLMGHPAGKKDEEQRHRQTDQQGDTGISDGEIDRVVQPLHGEIQLEQMPLRPPDQIELPALQHFVGGLRHAAVQLGQEKAAVLIGQAL